ncbi:MAG: UV-damage endonuclease [Alectoria sarmentosa]|nr:MAG: UV-damage endonuclease [Alectoria sarmentosa]
MAKRKSLSTATQGRAITTVPVHSPPFDDDLAPPLKRRASQRRVSQQRPDTGSTNPNKNANVLDAPEALRASPDGDETMDLGAAGMDVEKQVKKDDSDSPLSEMEEMDEPVEKKEDKDKDKTAAAKKAGKGVSAKKPAVAAKEKIEPIREPQFLDPEADGDEEADEEEIQAALSRPPPVNSDYLPLPWKGRLGYACLCTYLRFSNPPVFSSRTCRIASILENRHPLRDPNEPPHATKNRPDKERPADIKRGQAFVESLGIANAKDIVKMLRWNDRYGIKFLRLSSEMFPFASHPEYGYKLAPFVSKELAEAGKLATELGHRLTTHPGQYTQLGSPRKPVIDNAIRDLDYHAELLSLLKLPPQQDRDAVMILHLGGVFGDKAATLDRFRENYKKLPQGVKNRLVLENDDVSWSVHDLLPLCEELNIPMVLDFHHNNIIFDPDQIREGTKDIVDLFPRILATWKRKSITPKMHYSEPTPSAITGRQRRKHNPRVATLPPCPPDMDLMIEAKDKEQAVFELMRTFKLPGYDTFNDILPHVRKDDNKPIKTPKKKTPKKKKPAKTEDTDLDAAEEAIEAEEELVQQVILDDEVGMGGPEGHVYWPPGMEHWLRPVKKVIKPKEPKDGPKMTPAQKKKAAADAGNEEDKVEDETQTNGVKDEEEAMPTMSIPTSKKAKPAPKTVPKSATKRAVNGAKKTVKNMPTPTTSDEAMTDFDDKKEEVEVPKRGKMNGTIAPKRQSARAKKISYAETDGEELQ